MLLVQLSQCFLRLDHVEGLVDLKPIIRDGMVCSYVLHVAY